MKILVIRNGGMGDTLLLIPFLRLLKNEFSALELSVMGRKEVLDILVHEKIIDTAISFEREGIWKFFSENGNLPLELLSLFSSFGLIFSLANDEEGLFYKNLKRAFHGELRYGPPFPPMDYPFHVSRYYGDFFKLGPEEPDRDGSSFQHCESFSRRENDFNNFFHYFQEWDIDPQRDRLLALHPGSGSPFKNWPLEYFREAARRLAEKGWKVLWILGPTEQESGVDFSVGEKSVYPFQLPLPLLNSLLKFCAVYLGNDSGISHLAGLAGIPSLVIFGPSHPPCWRPLGPKVKVFSKGLGCSPCPQREWGNCPERECLLGISVEDVLTELEKL